MHLNWFGVACAAAAVALCFLLHPLLLKWPKPRRRIFAIAAALLALPGASFAIYYAHLLPEPAGYYEFRSWRGSEIALTFLGVAGAAVAAHVSRRLGTVIFIAVAVLAIVPLLKPFAGPIPDSEFKDHWDGVACRQSTMSTCGPAAVATLLRHHGVHVTERELAREAYTYRGGTEAWYLARAVRRRGLGARFDFRETGGAFAHDIALPVLAGVTFESFGHFIAILSKDGGTYHVADPINGSRHYTESQLQRRYRLTGFYMPISASPALRIGMRAELIQQAP
jgi:predicted double-glycine peptidase